MQFAAPPFRIRCASLSDVGRVRSRNKDRCTCDPALRLLAVADGMGGHASGDVASTLAIESLTSALQKSTPETATDAGSRLRAAVSTANAAILEAAAAGRSGMGTTIVAVLFDAASLIVAHVGDSRLYRLRAGVLESLTRDHSWVQNMIDLGFYSERRARLSPRRNQLLRALGVSADLEVDLTTHTLQAGDRYLLCSDGLNGMLDEVHIAMLLGAAGPPEERARWLVDAANDNGGRDNVTVAIADVSNADLAIA